MKKLLLGFILFFIVFGMKAQDPERFREEISKLQQKEINTEAEVLLFVGSSSFRFWKSLEDDIQGKEAVNFGFGGSKMKEVNYFYDELVAPYPAEMIFVYEGDNDIAAGESKKDILKEYKRFLKRVKKKDKQTDVILLAAKPSPLRWEFKEAYEELNAGLEKLSKRKHVYYLDIWSPMILENGEVDPDLFIQDKLHMNEKGYEIWLELVQGMIKQIDG